MAWDRHFSAEAFGVRVEPLSHNHIDQILQICKVDDYLYHPQPPLPFDEKGWAEFIDRRNANGCFGHAILCGEQLAGISSIYDFDLSNRKFEIGHTMVGRPFRKTQVNPASKLIFMTKGFEEWDCQRIQLKGDALNERSMRAMTSMGFKVEGVLRSFNLYADGRRRDVQFFSVLDTEWPDVKLCLEEMCRARMSRE